MTDVNVLHQHQSDNNEIDLGQAAAILLRHKLLISCVSLATGLISSAYAFTRQPVWEGSFQIVLENQSSNSGRLAQLETTNPLLANLAGLGSGPLKSYLATEVRILKSPSVLKPVYDFVKSKKASNGEDVHKWVYVNWVNSNLSIELSKGTSVLNISYRDSDKNLILPVLKRITDTYQEYSNRDSTQAINNALIFTTKQSKLLKSKANESNRRLDAFKFTYGISDDVDDISTALTGNFSPTALPGDFSPPMPQVSKGRDPFTGLAAINKNLTTSLQFFTENDPYIKRLQKEREGILQYINKTGGGVISIAGGETKEINREILLKYKELRRAATRDSAALTAMESQLLTLQIQKAQERQPWELISTPTVLDNAVAPRKKQIVALGLLGGLVLGSGAALFIDRRTGLVYSEDELKSMLPCPLIKHLPANAKDTWSDAVDLLAAGPLSESSGKSAIGLIPLGNVSREQLQAFSTELSRALNGRTLIVSTNLRETSKCATQLFITSPGVVTRTQLSQLRQGLALQGAPMAGWIMLDPYLNLG